MEIAAGEYGYDLWYFRRMLEAEAVDVLQADATRCRGYHGFFASCRAMPGPVAALSAHCGPSLHVHPCCSVIPLRHLEYFYDHVRIEHMLFDGAPTPIDGEFARTSAVPEWAWSSNTPMRNRIAFGRASEIIGCHGHCSEWPCIHYIQYDPMPAKAVGMAPIP